MSGKSPEIAVVGAGAIGGCIAASLGDADRAVSLCVRTPFEFLIRTFSGERTRYTHTVCTDPTTLGETNWVILCTKAHQSEAARAWLDVLVGPSTRVVVLQNGVDHVARIRPIVNDRATVLPCVILLPANALAPGEVEQSRPGTLQVPAEPAATEFAALFEGQDLVRVEAVDDFVSAAWSKLALNATGGICALAIKPLSTMTDLRVRDLVRGLVHEIVAVGEAEGAVFPDNFDETILATFTGKIESHWTSIAVDRRDGKPMEWEVRNAVVGRLGRKHGIATPLNDAITALLSVC